MRKQYILDARSATNHFPGIGRYVSNLANGMAPLLTEQEQLVLLVDKNNPSPIPLPPPTEKIVWRKTAVSPFSLAQQWQIPPLLKGAKVYHSPYYLMPYTVRLPTLLTFYDIIPQKYPAYVSVRARRLSKIMKTIALSRAKHVVCISEATQRDLLDTYHIQKEKVTAVPLAADPRFAPQSQEAVQELRTHYQLPKRFALYLGINKPHKNLLRLLQAWRQLENPNETLVIAGAWDERYPEAKQYAEQYLSDQQVRFLGRIANDDLPTLYTAATIFIFPSQYEGFGLPVIEAMACGTAVACANASSLPEVGGRAAVYFDPLNIDEMLQAIQTLLNYDDVRQEYAQLGQKQSQKFSWQKTAQATLNIYRRL